MEEGQLDGAQTPTKNEDADLEEARECERSGVLDPTAWQDREKWNGSGDAAANGFTAEKALGNGIGLEACDTTVRRRVDGYDTWTSSLIGQTSGPGRGASEIERLRGRGTEASRTSKAETMWHITGNGQRSRPWREGGENEKLHTQGTEITSTAFADVVRKLRELAGRGVRGEKQEVDKRDGENEQEKERENAAAGDIQRKTVGAEASAAHFDASSWRDDLGGQSDAAVGGIECQAERLRDGKSTSCQNIHTGRSTSAGCHAEGCHSPVIGIGRACNGGRKGGWALGEEDDEEEIEINRRDDDDDDRTKGMPPRFVQEISGAVTEAEQAERERIMHIMRSMMMARRVKSDHMPVEVDKGLFLGSVGAAHNRQELQKRGVTHVLTVANHLPPPWPGFFHYTVIEVLDSPRVDLVAHFAECFAVIDGAINSGGAILIHCFAGRSRSVTVMVGYLMKSQRLSLEAALNKVRRVRPEACPNSGFMRQLRSFEEKLVEEGVIATEDLRMGGGYV